MKRTILTSVVVWTVLLLQNCTKFQVETKIINQSNNRYYVSSIMADCDTCQIKKDIGQYLYDNHSFMQISDTLKGQDSLKYHDPLTDRTLKYYAVDIDSLNKYKRKGNVISVTKKPWIRIFHGVINRELKTCRIIIR